VILGATHHRAPVGFAGMTIGLALTLIHLVSIPVTNTSVNPARSTGPAVFVGGWALEQLWVFWVAPIVGAAIAGFVYKAMLEGERLEAPIAGRQNPASRVESPPGACPNTNIHGGRPGVCATAMTLPRKTTAVAPPVEPMLAKTAEE